MSFGGRSFARSKTRVPFCLGRRQDNIISPCGRTSFGRVKLHVLFLFFFLFVLFIVFFFLVFFFLVFFFLVFLVSVFFSIVFLVIVFLVFLVIVIFLVLVIIVIIVTIVVIFVMIVDIMNDRSDITNRNSRIKRSTYKRNIGTLMVRDWTGKCCTMNKRISSDNDSTWERQYLWYQEHLQQQEEKLQQQHLRKGRYRIGGKRPDGKNV